jgi:hypothetical protein
MTDDGEHFELPALPEPLHYEIVGKYDSFQHAKAAADSRSAFRYTYLTRCMTKTLYVRTYDCRVHVGYGHRVKIVRSAISETQFVYHVAEGSLHTTVPTILASRGIHSSLIDEVDILLRMGWGAKRLGSLMQFKFADDPVKLSLVPTARQLSNRKAYIVTHVVLGTSRTTQPSTSGLDPRGVQLAKCSSASRAFRIRGWTLSSTSTRSSRVVERMAVVSPSAWLFLFRRAASSRMSSHRCKTKATS